LADAIGASSGNYVRKVASGAKPGANLAANVNELMRTGEVTKPVERRLDAQGRRARVRAGREAGTPSRRPAETVVRPPGERTRFFTKANGKRGWTKGTGAADADGVQEFRKAVRAAGQGRHRVKLRVRVKD